MDLLKLLFTILFVFYPIVKRSEAAVPVFSSIDTHLQVREDSLVETYIGAINVTDPDGDVITSCTHAGDSGEFDIRTNTIVADLFDVYLLSGANIDFDLTPKFELEITCTDFNSESATVNITIDVVPNQPPFINAPSEPLSISENINIQTILLTLNVTDVENDVIYCYIQQITPISSAFDIWWDGSVGGYTLNVLNSPGLKYSSVSMYTITTGCWDSFGTSTSDVVVYIIPNTAPTFINLPATITLDASTTVMGSVVFNVSAFDNDSSISTYSVTSSPAYPDLFSIDTVSGMVTAQKELMYAVDNAYLLTIYVSDSTETTGDTLTVLLTNVNVAPTATNLPDIIYIDEDLGGPKTILFSVSTYDPDVGDTVSASMTVEPAVYQSKFSLETNNLRIRIQSGEYLDYEDQSSFVMQIMVSDGKAESGPYNLTVIVNDVNEACTFPVNTYYASMDEGNAGAITTDPGISVADDDVGDTYALSIDYTVSTDSSYFSIDDVTGYITFSTNYDVDSAIYPTNVNLIVICTDSRGMIGSTATVSVSILDLNDNAPEFTKAGYTNYITQYDGPGSLVRKLETVCDDDDSGVNGERDYTWTELTSGSSSYFYMSSSGQVALLTYPSLTMTYGDIHSFNVIATDRGTPSLSASATIVIIYQDGSTNSSVTIPTTTTAVSSTPSTVTAADDSQSFWDDDVNIIVVSMAAVLGALLTSLLVYTCVKLCGKLNNRRTHGQRNRGQRKNRKQKVEPLTDVEKKEFDFWNNSKDGIGGVTYSNLPM